MYIIKNVVATAHLNCTLPLQMLEQKLPLAFYNPKEFSGLLLRMFPPIRAHCQIYANGKITINGGDSIATSKQYAQKFCGMINECGFDTSIENYRVVNIVASLDYSRRLNLAQLRNLPRAVYEPELFPGLTLRMTFCTAVIFHTGKVNLLGAKTELELATSELELDLLIQ